MIDSDIDNSDYFHSINLLSFIYKKKTIIDIYRFYFFINIINNKPPPNKIHIIEPEEENKDDNESVNEVPILVNALGKLLIPEA